MECQKRTLFVLEPYKPAIQNNAQTADFQIFTDLAPFFDNLSVSFIFLAMKWLHD